MARRGWPAIRLLLVLVLLQTLVPTSLIGAQPSPAAGPSIENAELDTASLQRLSGASRYETAVEISKESFSTGASTVVVATGESFPDALSGGPLAAVLEAPLLLVRRDSVPTSVIAEIQRLGADSAVILGGTGAISTAVVQKISGLNGGIDVRRLGGSDRYVTSALIADDLRTRADVDPDTAMIATGQDFPDALAIAPYAAYAQVPILLVRKDAVPDAIARALGELSLSGTVIAGGTGAVSQAVADTLPNPVRLGGADRYQTSRLIADYGCENGLWFTNTMVATGANFPDALAAGPLGAALEAPLVLTPAATVSPAADAFVRSHRAAVETIWVIGGTGAVSQNVASKLLQASQTAIPDTTVVLNDLTRSLVYSVSADKKKIIFSEDSPQLDALSVGDIIVSEPVSEAPYGLLRKVTAIDRSSNAVIVNTLGAQLEDAMGTSSGDAVAELSPWDVASVNTLPGVTLEQSTDEFSLDDSFEISIDDVVLYEDGPASIKANGSISIEPDVVFNVSTEWLQLKTFLFKTSIDEEANVSVSASCDVVDLSKKVKIAEYWLTPITIPAGVPIVITPVLTVNVGLDGKVSVGIEAGATQTASLAGGIKYENGSWSRISEFENSFSFEAPAASASASAEVWAGPQLDLLLYGVFGPTATVKAYVELKASTNQSPPWTLHAGLKCDVGVNFTIFKVIDIGYSATVIDWKRLLASAETGNIAGQVTDSTTGGPLNDVTVLVQKNGQTVTSTSSGPDGRYSTGPLSPGGGYTVKFRRTGYVEYTQTGVTVPDTGSVSVNAMLTPMTATGSLRIVLTWGEYPEDLDSHLTGPLSSGERFHVYYNDEQAWDNDELAADLDVDDITSYGPETTTLRIPIQGTYRYSVHDFSNKYSDYSMEMAYSEAVVRVYSGSGLVATYTVPAEDGTLWTVFEWNGSQLDPINAMSYESDQGAITSLGDSAVISRDAGQK